jgi:hypothetical protein
MMPSSAWTGANTRDSNPQAMFVMQVQSPSPRECAPACFYPSCLWPVSYRHMAPCHSDDCCKTPPQRYIPPPSSSALFAPSSRAKICMLEKPLFIMKFFRFFFSLKKIHVNCNVEMTRSALSRTSETHTTHKRTCNVMHRRTDRCRRRYLSQRRFDPSS